MAEIRIVNWNELEKARRSGYYRRRAHREEANKKLERTKKLKPKTYNLKPTGGESLK
jgi:hypothetical protein